MDCGSGGPEEQHLGGFFRLQPQLALIDDRLNFRFHSGAVGIEAVFAAGDVGADVQKPQIVGEVKHIEIGHGNAGGFQGFLQLHVLPGVGAGQDEIRLGRQQQFQA